MSRLLLIDNYDSFVHNLARYCALLGQTVDVVRNDQLSVDEIAARRPAAIVLSPGPCAPQQAGVCLEVVRQLHQRLPILGVCLGHQAIAEALGGRVIRATEPVHGRASRVWHEGQGLFRGLPPAFAVGRYHSLVVDPETLPETLAIDAWTDQGVVMALRHRSYPVFGVQFHPESILTEHGFALLAAFLREADLPVPDELPTVETPAVAAPPDDQQWPLLPLVDWRSP